MTLETKYFKHDFYYDNAKVEKFIEIIKSPGISSQRQAAFKNVIFKMMKDVVKKNIRNYLNLLSNGTSLVELPTIDEVLADCYIIFDRCVEGYKVGCGYNFYFYFNKSLGRCFFRNWHKEMTRDNSSIEISNALETVNIHFHTREDSASNSMSMLLDCFDFSDVEIRIINSRIAGQKTGEFLKGNIDVTHGQYSQCLKRIRTLLQSFKEKGEL